MNQNGYVNTLRYRLLEVSAFLKEHASTSSKLGQETLFDDFAHDYEGEEAYEWFDESGNPLIEFDGIWHSFKEKKEND